ncbi:DUF4386 domain-containing protein [Niallia sp. 03190]|uniref:DUF4386 domain-containing protein n=1 Tax=Niallia sp. 03190 TaxID=3458061 RepID=UPI004044277D
MTTRSKYLNIQNSSAIIAGTSLLIMTFAAFFSFGYVHNSLVVTGDSASTLKNIQVSVSLFEFEILGWLVIIISDIVVSWAFYVFLKPIHPEYSLLAGLLRLVYTATLATAVSNLVIANNLVLENTPLLIESMDILASQVMTSIMAFESIWSIGLIIFGAHLMMIGYIALKARQIPKLISILLVAAGASYMLIHLLYSFFPQLDSATAIMETILSIPMIIGELGFGIWLLFKGRKISSFD